jgi:methylmalonyl-CoA mutase
VRPNTSVSMTINGPGPIMLAMFLNTAIDQQVDRSAGERPRPTPEESTPRSGPVLSNVRGTVQADILKEDQGQNTCIFSIDFALKMMGDIQQYFIENHVRNFYSVSIPATTSPRPGPTPSPSWPSPWPTVHLRGVLPVAGHGHRQLRPQPLLFFSNGMDPEYTVIGRVARRIWAVAMREKYGASPRSQMLKYHIQTSGRSLHSQDIQFNDIRTTLQALCAIYDNCNSLHTNAFDEAITTPSRNRCAGPWPSS